MLERDPSGTVLYRRWTMPGFPCRVYTGEAQLHIPSDTPGQVWLWSFEIHPPYRRQGQARSFLRALMREAKLLGFDHLHLWCGPENAPALALYTQAGGVRVTETERGVHMRISL